MQTEFERTNTKKQTLQVGSRLSCYAQNPQSGCASLRVSPSRRHGVQVREEREFPLSSVSLYHKASFRLSADPWLLSEFPFT